MTMTPAARRSLLSLVAATLLGALAAGLFAARHPVRVQASLSFAVNRISTVASQEYQYDGYYAIQAADLFSQTVVSWFSTPPVLRAVYEAAALTADVTSLADLTRHFKVKKVAAQNIVVTITESNRTRAEQLASAVTTTMQSRASALNQTADRKAMFELAGTAPLVVDVRPNTRLWALAGALVGFLVGLSGLSLTAYLASLGRPPHASHG